MEFSDFQKIYLGEENLTYSLSKRHPFFFFFSFPPKKFTLGKQRVCSRLELKCLLSPHIHFGSVSGRNRSPGEVLNSSWMNPQGELGGGSICQEG